MTLLQFPGRNGPRAIASRRSATSGTCMRTTSSVMSRSRVAANVEWLDVPAEHYGAAREIADELEAKRHWIMVPDDHALDGQVYGREEAR